MASVLLPELGSVRLRETESELVLEVSVPDEVDLSRLSAKLADGMLEIRMPRVQRRIEGFNPDASGV